MSIITDLTQATGLSVTLETSISPPITVDLAGDTSGGGGGSPSALMTFLKPKLTVTGAAGVLGTTAPYGEPQTPDTWLPLIALTGLGAFAFGALAVWIIRKV